MNLLKLAKELEGLQTVSSIAKILNISKRTAINYIWKLRKEKYLENVSGGRVRLYRISPLIKNKRGYSLYEILNETSKIKIAAKENYIIRNDKKPSVEEILVRCVASESFRVVLASLGLFNKIKSWTRLKAFAEKYNVERKIGALYEVARSVIKVRKMDERVKKGLLKGRTGYIIKNIKSKDFKNIEKKWKVFIPFNKQDLEVYKE